MKFKNITKKESGFTLVELIVAVGIFGILSVFVTGAFLNIMSIQRQAESKQQIMNDFRVALDLMGKEILDGSGFPDEEFGISSLYFQTKVRHDMISRVIQYKVVDGRLMKAQQDTQGECQVAGGSFPNECFVPFTSEEVDVDSLVFYINNFDENDDYGHPVITIVVSGEVDLNLGANPTFRTSVSFSPRAQISPDYQPPTDTTPPEVEIQQMDGAIVNSFPTENVTLNDEITLSGRVRDPGGSGIDTVYLRVRYQDDTGSILYTDNISSGFTSGSTAWHNWEFQNVDLYTTGDVSYIKVIATDEPGNTGNAEIKVRSNAPPPAPDHPSLYLSYSCLATSTDVDYVKIRMYSSDTDIDHYEIEKDGVFLDDANRTNDYTYYYDHNVSRGNDYTYQVKSVDTSWTFDVKSDPESSTMSLGADYCSVPSIDFFANEINCNLSNSPAINLRAKSSWSGPTAHFEFLDTLGNPVHLSSGYGWHGWWSRSEYSWLNQDPFGLSPGTYEYEARVCLGSSGDGGDCSASIAPNSGPATLEIDALTCVPPDTSFWEAHSGLQCSVDGDGNPSILLNLTVQREFPAGVRPFDTYKIYEKLQSDTVWSDMGSCSSSPTQTAAYDCVTKHYPRADAQYDYMVKAYNSNSGLSGNPEYYSLDIDGSMCDSEVGDWSDGPGGSVEANLICTEEPAHDFREVHVSVTDDYTGRDPAAMYRFYRCTSNVSTTCEPGHFDQITRSEQQAGDVVVDHGPADGTVHWYGTEICNFDGSVCSGMTFDDVGINLNECDPETSLIQTKNVGYTTSPSCYPPGSTDRDVGLWATSDNPSDSIYINIYRDGVQIVGDLDQGEVYTDEVPTGVTYTYEFEACNPLADVPCGTREAEDFTVVENICDPTTPTTLSRVVDCNELGQIESVTLTTGGSDYEDGYYIERSNPANPPFSCDGTSCTDTFASPIVSTSPVTYTYRSQSYRGTLTSGWRTKNIDLDPAVYCTAPFDLISSENFIEVTVTGDGQDQPSTATKIGVNPTGTFNSAVNFDVNDVEVDLLSHMTNVGVTENDVTVYLSRDILYAPYNNNEPILSITIPDEDYLGSSESVHGANIIVKGESEGFEAEVTVPLIIKWEAGSQD